MSWMSGLLALVPFTQAAEIDDAARVAKIEKMYDNYRKLGFAKVPDVDPAGLKALENPVLVDVRPEKERAVSMLPGAITKEAYEANPEAYSGRPIVPYCTIGARSGLYAKKLANDGVDVYNLKGSILLWTHEGGALQNEGGKTSEVHTYGRKWALVADGYTAVY